MTRLAAGVLVLLLLWFGEQAAQARDSGAGGGVAAAAGRTGWCSPTGDWCVAVYERRGRTMLSLRTFSFRGRVRVCVDPPRGGRDCRRFRLRGQQGGLFVVEQRWDSAFPDRGRGRYRVRWHPEAAGGARSPWLAFAR